MDRAALGWASMAQNHNPASSGPRSSSGSRSMGSVRPNHAQSSSSNSFVASRGNQGRSTNVEKGRGVRHLPYIELMERKSRGLCFQCGERYHPLHQCTAKSLSLSILGEGVESSDIAEEDLVAAMEVEQGTGEEKIECRIMGLLGFSTEEFQKCRFLHFEGAIHGASVLVLVDSGATNNFIVPQVVQSLGLEIDHSKKIPVKLGDGHCVFTGGKCSGVPLQVGYLTIVVEAFVLDLGGVTKL